MHNNLPVTDFRYIRLHPNVAGELLSYRSEPDALSKTLETTAFQYRWLLLKSLQFIGLRIILRREHYKNYLYSSLE